MPELYQYQKHAVQDLNDGKHVCLMDVGCLAKNTPIPLANGSVKLVQDLTKGDRLLSYNEYDECFISNEVDDVIRSSQNPKPMIQFDYDGEQIRTTYDHPFFNGDGYYPLYQLVWGALETSQRVQLKLLCKQYGQAFDDKAVRCKHCLSNETSEGRMWVLQDDDGRKDSQSPSASGRELAEKSQQIGMCEPFELRQSRQPSREPRVVLEKVQCLVGDNSWEYKEANQRGEQEADEGRQEVYSSVLSGEHTANKREHEKEGALRFSSREVSSSYSKHDTSSRFRKIAIKEAEPYYSICMRKAPYTYCIGRGHYFVTHNTGKTAVMFNWLKRTGKKNVVIITTATKAKSGDMEREAVLWCGEEWLNDLESFTVLSWHKADRFTLSLKLNQLDDYAFAFDEVQKSKGYSTGMGCAFRRICAHCPTWTGYTATPGDEWKDFVAYFTGAKLIKNKTQFLREFCIMQTFRGFPEITHYVRQDELLAMWRKISTAPDVSEMMRELPPERHKVVEFKAPSYYKTARKERRKENGEMIDTTMGLCHYLRQLCFTKEKQEWLKDFLENLGTNCIFFCNYIEEEEKLCEIAKKVLPKGAKIWRIDGGHHEIPTAETIGKYDIVVAHYLSGGEALNLQFMNYWVSVSPNYSYSTSVQARGRIKRIGQKHHFMMFYYLWSRHTIEDDIYACLKAKSSFSEKAWAEKLDKEDGLC